MALDTSAQSPAPVRQIANLVAQYVDRLGVVWVEGQIAQVSRRPGLNTIFMTLRDAVADISVPLTAPRSVVDSLATPLVEGASVIVQAKPSYYANRGSFSLAVREIRMVGLGELLAGSSGVASCWPPKGCSRASSSGRCRSCPTASGWSPRRPPQRSATCSTTPGAAGPTSSSRWPTPPCRASAPPRR